jgi:hypothetical protein
MPVSQNGFHFVRPQWFPVSECIVATSLMFDSIAPGHYRLGAGREHLSVIERQNFNMYMQHIVAICTLKSYWIIMVCDHFLATVIRTGTYYQAGHV